MYSLVNPLPLINYLHPSFPPIYPQTFRRLSSKKRRKQNQDICGGEGTGYGSECSNWSPGGSSSGPGGSSSGSPSTASNSCTPVSVERR